MRKEGKILAHFTQLDFELMVFSPVALTGYTWYILTFALDCGMTS